MADITLSKATRSNLLNLQSSATLLARTQERLSTGNKVNSALDNPTNFFTASSLNSRASDLSLLQDSVSNAVQTLQAADNGISSITKLVESAQAAARQALQSPKTVEGAGKVGSIEGGVAIDVTQMNNITADVGAKATTVDTSAFKAVTTGKTDSIGDVTLSINGVNLTVTKDDTDDTLKGKLANAAASSKGKAGEFTFASGKLASLVAGQELNVKVVKSSAGEKGDATAAPDAAKSAETVLKALGFTEGTGNDFLAAGAATADIKIAAGGTDGTGVTGRAASDVGININGEAVTITHNDSADTILSKFKQAAQKSRGKDTEFTAEINAKGVLQLQAKNDGKGITILGTSGTDESVTAVSSALGLAAGDLTSGKVADATTARNDANVKNDKRKEYVDQYNELLNQIDEMSADASFNGINLLAGKGNDLRVVFNEDGSSKLDIDAVDFSSGSLGLNVAVDTDFDDNDAINKVLGTLKSSLDTLRTQASKFGTNLAIVQARQDFTKNMINTLQTGAGNLTLADNNEEGANMLALQTRQQLSTTALSMASQADQNVLRLF